MFKYSAFELQRLFVLRDSKATAINDDFFLNCTNGISFSKIPSICEFLSCLIRELTNK